jgi:hypothetical protein
MMPQSHQRFLDNALNILKLDQRILGVLGAGSMISKTMDEYSDLDFIVVCSDDKIAEVSEDKLNIVKHLGEYLSSFTGEHIGDSRVLICLYKNPLLHVDVKFISLSDLKIRIENPVILFERDKRISTLMNSTTPNHPMPDLQWIEDRFWTWIHYGTLKLGRGELFEVIGFLSFLRVSVFGPLALMKNNELPRGVRRIETLAANYTSDMEKTVATNETKSCARAIEAAIFLYQRLRTDLKLPIELRSEAEMEAIRFFHQIAGEKNGL